MPAIKDKETGERRELTRSEKDRIAANMDEARNRRLQKQRIAENKAKAREIKEHRRKEAKEKEINEALADAFDQWNA